MNPPVDSGPIEQARKWPTVIGVICIVFAALGLTCYGCGGVQAIASPWLAGMAPEDQRPPTPTGVMMGIQIFQLCSASLLSVWLLIVGIGLVKMRAWSAKQSIGWAVTKIILVIVSTVLSMLLVDQVVKFYNDMLTQGGGPAPFTVTRSMVLAISIAILLWYLAWPVFLIIWFSRRSTKEQVAAWEAESRAAV